VLVNAMLLAEGWNSPRATVVMHLAPTAKPRLPAAIGRIMRLHPRKEAGIVVDFVQKGATHTDRVVTLHSLLGADFYREGARVTPAPRRRVQRRARRRLSPRRGSCRSRPTSTAPGRDPARVAARRPALPRRGGAAVLGPHRRRQARFDDRVALVEKLSAARARRRSSQFLFTCAAENPNRRLRLMALSDRVSTPVDRMSFDDLVTWSRRRRPWEKDRVQGVAAAAGDRRGQARRPDQILARWTWRSARAVRKVLDRKASAEYPEAKRLLGALANSRGQRHEENAVKLAGRARSCRSHRAALLASADGYTPRANHTTRTCPARPRNDSEVSTRARRRPPRADRALGDGGAPAAGKKKPATAAAQDRPGQAAEQNAAEPAPPAQEQRCCNNQAGFGVRITNDGPRDRLRVRGGVDHGGVAVRPARPADRVRGRAGEIGADRSRSFAGLAFTFLVSILFAAWLLDALGLPKDLLGTSRSRCSSCSPRR
jgi:hypothetical protein